MKHATEYLSFETPITVGRLALGEQLFYAEFDGRRRKRVVVKAVGE